MQEGFCVLGKNLFLRLTTAFEKEKEALFSASLVISYKKISLPYSYLLTSKSLLRFWQFSLIGHPNADLYNVVLR